MKKRMITSVAVAMLIMALLPTTAFAHDHNGRGASVQGAFYALCVVEGCNTTGTHQHNNTFYSGHKLGDGHDYHQVCTVQDCVMTTNHEHDGVACFPHNSSDGHGYHSSGGRHH